MSGAVSPGFSLGSADPRRAGPVRTGAGFAIAFSGREAEEGQLKKRLPPPDKEAIAKIYANSERVTCPELLLHTH